MIYVWHILRVSSAAALLLFAATFGGGILSGDEWSTQMLAKIAAALGVLLPMYVLWSLVRFSTRKIRAASQTREDMRLTASPMTATEESNSLRG